jgi:hypothetical protein
MLIKVNRLAVARYGGPGASVLQINSLHMVVNKPQHLNDMDLLVDGPWPPRPTSEATDMSYFLQRIRLAEISRNIVDHTNASHQQPDRQQPAHHANLIAVDAQLEQMVKDTPASLQLKSYQATTDCGRTSNFFIQAYMLNSLLHTQRCKLHLTYLTSGGPSNPICVSSRTACLASARELIRAETQLLASNHPFARAPLRPPAILYSIFVASIVLFMDACLNRPSELQDEVRRGDLGEALAIIRGAKDYSLASAKLYEQIIEIMGKYRAVKGISGDGLAQEDWETSANTFCATDQDLGDPMYLDLVQWDDLFSGISSSSSSAFF